MPNTAAHLRLSPFDATPQAAPPATVRPWQFDWLRRLVHDGPFPDMTGAERAVLVVLLAHADAQEEAWPSTETLGQRTRLSRRGTQQALRDLADLRRVVARHRPGYRGRASATFTFTWSGWANTRTPARPQPPAASAGPRLGEATETPARTQPDQPTPRGAHPSALEAHPSALEAHPSAPAAHPSAPNEEKRLREETPPPTRERCAPSEPPTGNGRQTGGGGLAARGEEAGAAGIFDAQAMVELLLARGFTNPRDAAGQVRAFGIERCKQGVAHCDFLQVKGEIRKSWVHAFVYFLKSDRSIDARIERERRRAEARERAAACAAQAQAEKAAAAAIEAEQAVADLAMLRELTAERLAELTAQALASMPPAIARIHADHSALDSPGLRAAVLGLLSKEGTQP